MKISEFSRRYVSPFSLSIMFLIVGTTMNSSVVYFNDGRMPIIEDDRIRDINDSTHFTITNRTEVKLYYLGDIFKARLKKKDRMVFFSVGDVFLWIGLCITIITGLYLVLRIIWENYG